MTDIDPTASGAVEEVQEPSGAAPAVQEPSGATLPVQEPPDGDAPEQKPEPTPEEVEAQRRAEQAENDRQQKLREINAEAEANRRRAEAAEARAAELERQRLSEAEAADRARLRQLRQDDPDAYLEEMDRREREAEVRNSTYPQALAQGHEAAFQTVYSVEVQRAKADGMTDREIQEAVNAAAQAGGFTDRVPFAVAADAVVQARFAKVSGELPTLREKLKAAETELEAANNELATLRASNGGPPRSPNGSGPGDNALTRERAETAPIEELIRLRRG